MDNILKNIDLIHRYLSYSIRDQFKLRIDLNSEYIFTQNIVSKKTIIATTFTRKILFDPQLKLFLSALICEINSGRCTINLIREKIRYFEEIENQGIKKIV